MTSSKRDRGDLELVTICEDTHQSSTQESEFQQLALGGGTTVLSDARESAIKINQLTFSKKLPETKNMTMLYAQ